MILVRRKRTQRGMFLTCSARTCGRSDAFMTRKTTPLGGEFGLETCPQQLGHIVEVRERSVGIQNGDVIYFPAGAIRRRRAYPVT